MWTQAYAASHYLARYIEYADDVSVLITSSAEVDEGSEEIRRYEVVTGAKINREKYFDLQLGSWKGQIVGRFQFETILKAQFYSSIVWLHI